MNPSAVSSFLHHNQHIFFPLRVVLKKETPVSVRFCQIIPNHAVIILNAIVKCLKCILHCCDFDHRMLYNTINYLIIYINYFLCYTAFCDRYHIGVNYVLV